MILARMKEFYDIICGSYSLDFQLPDFRTLIRKNSIRVLLFIDDLQTLYNDVEE